MGNIAIGADVFLQILRKNPFDFFGPKNVPKISFTFFTKTTRYSRRDLPSCLHCDFVYRHSAEQSTYTLHK
uniref:Uncharacterized protein n=1 Tax=Trichogramma kaykai TaxID=54128 RepID=A0ABD2WVK8_9HYME